MAKISDTATEIQKNGDFSKRIEIDDGQDEIHKMANAFNEMLNHWKIFICVKNSSVQTFPMSLEPL